MSRLSADDVLLLLPRALDLSADDGARTVALHWLHALQHGREEWAATDALPSDGMPVPDGGGDRVAALHKARVALRRLRSTLKEFPTVLDVGRDATRALRKLNARTNGSRDSDVQRAWLAAECEALDAPARREARALLDTLEAKRERQAERVSASFTRILDRWFETLAERLSHYCEARTVGQQGLRQSYAALLAVAVGEGAARVELALQGVSALAGDRSVLEPAQGDALHALRILLKRQRAMLAPFNRSHPALAAWYDLATRGQDALGAMRDAVVLRELAMAQDRFALAAALEGVALGHFDAFRRAWCADTAAIARVGLTARDAVAALDAHAASNALPQEIERKYLLQRAPDLALQTAPSLIEQGWLPGEVLRERLRRRVTPDGQVQLTRTVKAGALGQRVELEEPCPPALFEVLWPYTAAARIRKHRHVVPAGGYDWEIDVFLDRELVLAEVELAAGDAIPPAPEWLSPLIVADVTEDPAYANSRMAKPDAAGHGSLTA